MGAPAQQPRQVHPEPVAGVAHAPGREVPARLIRRDGDHEPAVGEDFQCQSSRGLIRRPGPTRQQIGSDKLDPALHRHRLGLGGGRLGLLGRRVFEQPAVMDHRAAGQGPVRAHGPHVQKADLSVVERLGYRDGEGCAPIHRSPGGGPAKAAFALGHGFEIAVVAVACGDPADQRAADDARHHAFDQRVQIVPPVPAGPSGTSTSTSTATYRWRGRKVEHPGVAELPLANHVPPRLNAARP